MNPDYYIIGDMECREVIDAVSSRYPPGVGFYVGSALKYIWRAPCKNAMLDDLRKARQNIDFLIAALGG